MDLKNTITYYVGQVTEPDYMAANPIFVQIEPTRRCNLNCKFCDRTLEKERKEELSLEDFKTILKKMPFLKKISLVGVGEPLLNRQLFEIIAYAKSRGIKIGFATNATLLTDDISGKIISSGLDWINISLDGATKKTFENIREGANFEKVLENVENLMIKMGEKPKPKVSVWFLAVAQNIHELRGMILLTNKLHIKRMKLQIAHYWAKDTWRDKVKSEAIKDMSEFKSIYIDAKAVARDNGVCLDYVNVPEADTGRQCKWPWKACYITADGFITPCCMHGTDPEILNFGNIFKEEFGNIWNNDEYREFRRKLKSKDIPFICIGCPSYYRKIKI